MKSKTGKKSRVVFNRKYYVMLTVSSVCTCLIGMLVLMAVMFSWFWGYMQEEMARISYDQLGNTCQTVQERLDLYRTLLQNYFQESMIRVALYSDEQDPMREYNIGRGLNTGAINDGLIDYTILFKDGKIKQTAGPVYPFLEEQEEVLARLVETKNDREIFCYRDTKKQQSRLFLFLTERDRIGSAPRRGLLFAVNRERLSGALLGAREGNPRIWVYGKDGTLLLEQSAKEQESGTEIWETVLQAGEEKSMSGISYGEEGNLLIARWNASGNLMVAQLVDSARAAQTLQRVRTLGGVCVLIMLAVCLAAAFLLTRYLVLPLRGFVRALSESAGLNNRNGENEQLTQVTSERILSEVLSMSRKFHTDQVLSYLEDVGMSGEVPEVLKLSRKCRRVQVAYIGSLTGKIMEADYALLQEEVRQQTGEMELYLEEGRHYAVLLFWEAELDNLGDRVGAASRITEQEQLGNISQMAEQEQAENASWMTEQEQLGNVSRKTEQEQEENTGRKTEQERADAAGRAETVLAGWNVFHGQTSELYVICSQPVRAEKELQAVFRELRQLSKYALFDGFARISSAASYADRMTCELPRKIPEAVVELVKQRKEEEARVQMAALLAAAGGCEMKSIFRTLADLAVELGKVGVPAVSSAPGRQEQYTDCYIKLTSLRNRQELEEYFTGRIEAACLEIRTSGERSFRNTMLEAVQYIEAHYQEPGLSVEQIANTFHISNSYFSQMFNEVCGLSFPEYVNELRLNCSAEYLRTTDLSVKEIAARSGFSGVSYFGVQFKKKYGMSPSAYRTKER